MTAEESLAVSKTFTKNTVIGMGAVKGAPCTVKSIEPVPTGNRITFEWEDKNGGKHTSDFTVKDGLTVSDIQFNDDNCLVVTFTDGSTLTSDAIRTDDSITDSSTKPAQSRAVKMYADMADSQTLNAAKDYVDSKKKPLCQHFVTFGSSTYGSLWFSMKFINKSESPMTMASLAQWLYNAGYTSGSNAYGVDNSSTLIANLDGQSRMWWVYACSAASASPDDLVFYVCNTGNVNHRQITVESAGLTVQHNNVNKLGYILSD